MLDSARARRKTSNPMTANSNLLFQPSKNCPSCGFPLGPQSSACSRCATTVSANGDQSALPIASLRHGGLAPVERLTAMAFDVFLALITAGVGWFVWTLILLGDSQTPAKRLRDHVVVDSRTARPASKLRFLSRELLIAIEFVYVAVGVVWGFGIILDIGGYWFNSWILPGFILSAVITDIAWLFLPARRRLVDVILRTNVVSGEGYSFQQASVPLGGR